MDIFSQSPFSTLQYNLENYRKIAEILMDLYVHSMIGQNLFQRVMCKI
jgi:hypothetical protein